MLTEYFLSHLAIIQCNDCCFHWPYIFDALIGSLDELRKEFNLCFQFSLVNVFAVQLDWIWDCDRGPTVVSRSIFSMSHTILKSFWLNLSSNWMIRNSKVSMSSCICNCLRLSNICASWPSSTLFDRFRCIGRVDSISTADSSLTVSLYTCSNFSSSSRSFC